MYAEGITAERRLDAQQQVGVARIRQLVVRGPVRNEVPPGHTGADQDVLRAAIVAGGGGVLVVGCFAGACEVTGQSFHAVEIHPGDTGGGGGGRRGRRRGGRRGRRRGRRGGGP